jgi:hypothetical protein
LTALIICAGIIRICEAQAPQLDVLLARLSAYLLDYETKVFELAAEEQYKQWVKRRSGWGGDTVARRNLTSTYFLVRLPTGQAWFGFRDVTRVDGHDARRQGRSMEQLLGERTVSAYDEAMAIVRENAKYNIGNIYRTINVPLQALDLLHPENRTRFDFSAAGQERVGGQDTEVIAFQERSVPTLVSDGFGGELLAHGRVWVDPATGAVFRTELGFNGASSLFLKESKIRVDYRRDPKLQVLVPSEMEETYGFEIEVLHGEATYRNYRKFQTEARMVTPE